MRHKRIALIAIVLVPFLAVSVLLARVFSADGAERSAITSLVEAEARGDSAAVIAALERCGAGGQCRALALSLAAALKRPGHVTILQIEPSSGFSLGSTLGTARVAWRAGSQLPVVQCVRVRRAGDALSGLHIELLTVSPQIRSDAGCPARF
jgi:hypothetical protein